MYKERIEFFDIEVDCCLKSLNELRKGSYFLFGGELCQFDCISYGQYNFFSVETEQYISVSSDELDCTDVDYIYDNDIIEMLLRE